jgi:hypothetical protein
MWVDVAPGVLPMLRRLKEKYFLFLCTAGATDYAKAVQYLLNEKLGGPSVAVTYAWSFYRESRAETGREKNEPYKNLENVFPVQREDVKEWPRVHHETVIVDDKPRVWVEGDRANVMQAHGPTTSEPLPVIMTANLEAPLHHLHDLYFTRGSNPSVPALLPQALSSLQLLTTPPSSPSHF